MASSDGVNTLQIFSSALGRDPRPTRFYALLRELGAVTVCSAPPMPGFEPQARVISLPGHKKTPLHKALRAARLLARRYEADIWTPPMRALFERLKGQQYAAVVCHDALLLPLALAVRDARPDKGRRCPVIMDAREFYPRQFEHHPLWRLVLRGINDYVCRRHLPQADVVFTVSPGLAEGYRREYGLECLLLPSFSDFQDLAPRPSVPGPMRCIHHGAAAPGRQLENMIEAFASLEGKASLDFMLAPNNPRYLEKLRVMAAPLPNVDFVEPVPLREIVTRIASYDMGVYLLNGDSFNHRHALPNKFFEYLQARLAVAVSPVPDMADMVRKHGLGVVAADFTPQAFAGAIADLSREDLERFKANAHTAARQFCWENNESLIRNTLLALMDN